MPPRRGEGMNGSRTGLPPQRSNHRGDGLTHKSKEPDQHRSPRGRFDPSRPHAPPKRTRHRRDGIDEPSSFRDEVVDRAPVRGRGVPSSLNRTSSTRRCNVGEEGTPMLRVLADEEARAELRSTLDDLVLEGARRMLAAALEAEVDAYVTALAEERDEHGRRLVVRNGHAEP